MNPHHPDKRLLAATAVLALGITLLMWAGYVLEWAWLARLDAWALEPAYRFGTAHPLWVTAWDTYCRVFSPVVFRLVMIGVIVVVLIRRQFRIAVFLLLTVELSGLLTETAKNVVDRSRPAGEMVAAASTSFPSGHALGLMVIVLALLTVALPLVRPSWRIALIVLGVALVVTVGAARVILNVHHPSDVLAGWSLGYAWFVLCLLVAPPTGGAPGLPVTRQDETPAAPGNAR